MMNKSRIWDASFSSTQARFACGVWQNFGAYLLPTKRDSKQARERPLDIEVETEETPRACLFIQELLGYSKR